MSKGIRVCTDVNSLLFGDHMVFRGSNGGLVVANRVSMRDYRKSAAYQPPVSGKRDCKNMGKSYGGRIK